MKFCKECGTELDEHVRFCTACGKENTPTEDKVQPESVKRNQSPQKKPLSKKTKWMIGSIAGLLLIGFGIHQFLSSYFDPVKELKAMDQAISEDDADNFINNIRFKDAALLDKESYFQYIKENEWHSVKSQFIDILEMDEAKNYQLNQPIFSENGEELFTVQKDSVLLGLYTTYSLHATPTKLIVTTNLKDAEITIDNTSKNLEDTGPKELGKLYPGNYQVSGSAKNMFGDFDYKEELEVFPGDTMEIDIEFPGETYTFDTNQGDAVLFANGIDTGKTLSEFDYLGPIPENSDMELHAEWESPQGKVIKSDILTIQDLGWYGFSFYFDDSSSEGEPETKVAAAELDSQEPEDIVLHFREAYENALNSKDFSIIESYLKKDSAAYKELKKYIKDLKDTAYDYDFHSNEVLQMEEISKNKYEITTNEQFTFTNHLNEQTDYDRTKIYTLVSADDTFKISQIDYVETNREE
ncbi:zinc ribbon domain-containing protein [Virgibacillus halodenitrificans]|uniref:zinc ribbon domain-containing protein n=1 Tax=Virgibacillus halodenitrificans TaxID=1482 RepID=UPI000EF4C6F5|nr:zinc-ribbon domain-containing protein [Virgibacillus halodenitrificans]